MATLEEKWKNWLEEREKERGNLDTPSPFSSEELDQLLKQAADILGIDLQQTQQPQQTSQLPVRGSIAATPYQRMVQSLDEALLPERIREDIQEGQYDRSTAYAFMPIWGPIEALLQTAPGRFIDRASLGAIDAIFRDPTYTSQYRQDITTGNTTADAIAETIGNIIGSMWLFSQAGQPAQAAAQLANNQLAQALIRGVGTAGMTHLLQSISAPEEYRPTFDEFAQRAAWLTTTGALAPSVTNLYDTLAGQSGLNRVLFNPIVRSGVTGAATGGIGSLASQAAAGFKDAENIGDVLKKAGTDALVYGGFQALMQLPGMIGNREVHNIYARGANAQKAYANLIQKVIDGTATPDEVNQLRESIIQYGKAAQDIYPHAMRQAPAGTKLSREEFVRGFLRLLSPLADHLPSNISGDQTIEFFAHLITGKVIDVTPNTSANVPAVVKPVTTTSQQSTDVPAVAATAEINVPTTSVATTTSQTHQFVPQPTAQSSQISPISGAEQINKPQDNELHIEEKQPVREPLNDSRSENLQQFTLVDLGTRFMNIYQQYQTAALNNQKVRPELVNLFINAGNDLKEYLQKQGGISRTRELPNLIQRLHNDGIKLPDFQQALQTHAEVVEAQEKVEQKQDIETVQQPTHRRKLGLPQKQLTGEEFLEGNSRVWIFLSNLEKGDVFYLGQTPTQKGERYEVKSITDKSLQLLGPDGKIIRITTFSDSPKVDRLLRDIDDQLTLELLSRNDVARGIGSMPLHEILKRDNSFQNYWNYVTDTDLGETSPVHEEPIDLDTIDVGPSAIDNALSGPRFAADTESAPQQTVEAVRTSKEEQQTTAHAAETTGRPVARKIEPTGRVSVTYTPEGTRVETKFVVVDVNDLVTSDMANYPQELQPRDRTRLASQLQIEKIANTLTPERLGDSPDPGSGSPIVGDDLVVESGNGRVMAIRKAFENPAKLEEYKQWLRENAANFGIDPAIVDNIETPVLVRVRTSDVDRVQFTQEANRPVVASMSPVEQAKVDAQKLTIDLLSSFVPSETGRISTRDNKQFITEFFAKVVGTTELGEYLTDDGELNRRGVERIQNAILAKAYGENIYVLSKLLEETDDNIRRVTAGLLNAAGSFAKIKEGIANGDYFDLDITNELTNAAGQLSHLRNRGMTVGEYLQTVALPGMEDLTDTEKLLLQKLDQFGGRGGSQKKLTAFLKNYVRLVQEVGSPKQEVLPGFEKEPPTKDELIEAASSRVAIDLQLFAQKGDGDIDGEQAYTADDWAELLHRFAGITEEVAAGESPAAVSDQQAAGGQEGTGTPGERSTVPQQPEQAESAEQTDIEDETGKPIKRIEIVHKLRQLATIYEKRMRLSAKRHRGEYHPKTQVIRVKSIEDIDALAHELGHYLQDVWEFDPSGNAELVRMGTELYADRADKMTQKRLAEEGFAEYMRYWMQYPQILEHKAPNFKETFDSLLNSDPELAKELTELRDMYKQWQNLNATDRIKGQIVTDLEATKPREFLTPLQKAYTKTTDNLHPLFRFMETMLDKKLNSEWEVELDKNPYIMARMARAAKKIAEVMVNFKGVTPEGRIEGKSLAEILQPIKSELEDFTAWLVAKRAAELHNRGIKTGFDHADVEITIHELEKPIYLEVQKDLEAYQNNLLDFLVDSGMVSQEQAGNWKTLNQFYVPFYRFFDDEYRFSGKVSSKRYADLNKPIKGIKGSERSIIDPLESIIKNTYTFIDLAAKNKVGLAIAKLADDPDVVGKGWLIHEVKTPMEPQKVNLEQLKSDLVDAGIPEEIIDMVDLDKWATVFRPVQFARIKEKQENILTVYQNGKPRFFKVHPELYETIMAIEPNTSSVLTQFLAPFVAVKRALATGFNPNFIFGRNPVRDAQTAQFFSKYGFVPFIDTLRGISHVLKRDEIYYEWLVNGGGMSTMISLDRKYLRGELESILKDEHKTRPRDLVKKGWQWYLALAEGLEEATRVQVYAKGKEAEMKARGADTKEGRTWAAYASREATLDFQRYGTVGKAVNNFKAFFNANVQGTDKALRYIKHQIKTNPVGFIMRAFLRITLPSLLLYLMNKDDAEYWELPEWRRDLYWNIKIAPGRWMTVPKPEVLGVFFGAIPERFFDYVNTNDPEAFEELGKNVAESLLPATSVWDLVPDAVLPILEVTANYDSWRGRQIETLADRNKPPEERYGMWTSETAKAIGAMFGVSPKKVEHLLEGYGSGTVSFLLDMIDLMTEVGRSKSDIWSSIPVVSGFVTSSYRSPESVDDFYNTLEEYELYYPDHPYTTILRKYSRELSDLRKQINDIMESPKFDRSYKQKMLEQYNKQAVQIAKLALLRKPKQPPRKQ